VDDWVIAVDIGAERLSAALVGAHGEIILRDRVTTPNREIWPALERLIRRVVAARPADLPRPLRCGVTCDGPIDRPAGLVSPLTIPSWDGFELRARLEELTGLGVVLETRGNGRALAERWVGGHALPDADNLVVVIVSESVDGGIIADGKLVRGRLGNAGNIGHVTVEPDGLECICGARGCLAAYVSSTSLESETNRPVRRVPASIVERTGIMIGRAISSTAAAFDTQLALVGGSVPAAFGQPVIEAIEREVHNRSKLSHLDGLRVGIVTLGLGGTLLAAAAAALDTVSAG
jgi:glucokinase